MSPAVAGGMYLYCDSTLFFVREKIFYDMGHRYVIVVMYILSKFCPGDDVYVEG